MNQKEDDRKYTLIYGRELAKVDTIATYWMRTMISHPKVWHHFLLDLILKYWSSNHFEHGSWWNVLTVNTEHISGFDSWKRIGKTQDQLRLSLFDGGPAGL